MNAHTPGPCPRIASETLAGWKVEQFEAGMPWTIATGLSETHARQLAAAPALLEALERCRALLSPGFCAGDPAAEEMRRLVRAALAAAQEGV